VTCASRSDAVVILEGQCLALVNIDRQVHALRAKAPLLPRQVHVAPREGPPSAAACPSASTPPLDPGEDDFQAPRDERRARKAVELAKTASRRLLR
jgi:hypothetical protein